MTEDEIINEINLITPKKFYENIQKLVDEHDLTIMEAIDEYTKNYTVINEETVASLIKQTPSFKAKLREECEEIHLVQKEDSRIDYE